MAKKRKQEKRQPGRISERLNNMSQEEIAERWRQMRPRYFRWLGLFTLLAAIMFSVNHALIMQFSAAAIKQNDMLVKLIGFLNAAFQISCIFWVLFVFLVGMSYFYGKVPAGATAE